MALRCEKINYSKEKKSQQPEERRVDKFYYLFYRINASRYNENSIYKSKKKKKRILVTWEMVGPVGLRIPSTRGRIWG